MCEKQDVTKTEGDGAEEILYWLLSMPQYNKTMGCDIICHIEVMLSPLKAYVSSRSPGYYILCT